MLLESSFSKTLVGHWFVYDATDTTVSIFKDICSEFRSPNRVTTGQQNWIYHEKTWDRIGQDSSSDSCATCRALRETPDILEGSLDFPSFFLLLFLCHLVLSFFTCVTVFRTYQRKAGLVMTTRLPVGLIFSRVTVDNRTWPSVSLGPVLSCLRFSHQMFRCTTRCHW